MNHFARGVAQGTEILAHGGTFTVAINRVWGARWKEKNISASISSYEKIGYHTGSEEFYKGVLSTGCRVVEYVEDENGKIVARLVQGEEEKASC